MNYEKYIYLQDIRDKKITSHSAAKKVGGEKSTRCTLPSDYMSKKEIDSMSGECVSYNINKRLTWNEFTALPDDIKCVYIKFIRQKYGVSDREIAEMLCVSKNTLGNKIRRLGIGQGEHTRGRTSKDNKARFYKDFGMDMVTERATCEAVGSAERNECEKVESDSDDIKVIEYAKKHGGTPIQEAESVSTEESVEEKPSIAIPERCTFVFNSSVRDALIALEAIIGSGYGVLTVTFSASENDRSVC
ncbi:MAG: hypothetical protein ACI3XQ_06050 [Eubacteriales bacterium]